MSTFTGRTGAFLRCFWIGAHRNSVPLDYLAARIGRAAELLAKLPDGACVLVHVRRPRSLRREDQALAVRRPDREAVISGAPRSSSRPGIKAVETAPIPPAPTAAAISYGLRRVPPASTTAPKFAVPGVVGGQHELYSRDMSAKEVNYGKVRAELGALIEEVRVTR
jgi:hypothetical protein